MTAQQSKLLDIPERQDAFVNAFVEAIRERRDLLVKVADVEKKQKVDAVKVFEEWADVFFGVVWTDVVGRNAKDRPTLSNLLQNPTSQPQNPSPLSTLSPSSKGALTRTLILLSITHTKRYDARTRHIISRIALYHLRTPFPDAHELVAAEEIKHPDSFSDDDARLAAQKREEHNKSSRGWKVGVAALAGGLAIGVTGGLAAPLVGAGLASVLGAVGITGSTAAIAGTIAGSSTIMSGLFGYYGYGKASKMMEAHTKEVSDFAFIPMNVSNRLHVTICISGWLKDESEVTAPWKGSGEAAGDVYALRWEIKALQDLHNALYTLVKDHAYAYIKKEIIAHTVLQTLFAGLWPMGLVKFGKVIDNPWNNALALAEKAGKVLADLIRAGVQGGRPVSLVGYSLGALVIYHCLLTLAKDPSTNPPPQALISNVYLFGLPAPTTPETWKLLRTLVSGRLVNAYTPKDWMLAFLHRTHLWDSGMRRGVAGVMPVEGVEGVENVEVGSVVEGQVGWRVGTGVVMRAVGVEGGERDVLEDGGRGDAEGEGIEEVAGEVKHAKGRMEVVDGEGVKKVVSRGSSEVFEKGHALPPLPPRHPLEPPPLPKRAPLSPAAAV
ncbi:hypothetical protein HDV00_010509 [Rhizophlyctis rosea]|nr:hypothetical protein HDV00_010509 [Rhizophlyctis rosea]